ncbi:MAG TPA: hypothetical protein DIT25_00755, partial [Candidatus Moranbacteria bacterium]|nr:hypothetical protein [Candidatus Moranbacteria bacterium]
IWKYLTVINDQGSRINEQYPLHDIITELESDNIKRFIEEDNGFHFLKGRKDLVGQRIRRNKISEQKMRIARRAVWWLRFVPFIKFVAVTGRLAMKNAERRSDIDILVAFKKGKIFTGRFFLTGLIHLLGKRRHGKKITNRICLNHFITDDFQVSVKDIFSAHEYSFMTPLFNGGEFGKFHAANDWIGGYKKNFVPDPGNLKIIKDSFFPKIARAILEKILLSAKLEQVLKKYQIGRIKKNPLTEQNGGIVIYGDEELGFWPNFENQGPKVFEQFKKTLNDLAR